ncbi:MAG: O-antigen ligase family protein [Holophagales bacterium]|nr:O-antigen ligase family protein [Holophagales bacterium]
MTSGWRSVAERLFASPEGLPDERKVGFWLFAAHLLTIWGLALSNAFMGLTALWVWVHRRQLRASGPAWRDLAVLFVPAGLYGVFFVVSILGAIEPAVSLGELRDLLSFATLGLAPILVRGEAEVRRVVRLFAGMVVLLAVHGIGQSLLTDYGSLHRRIVGLFSHYQTFAGVLLLGTLVWAAHLATRAWRQPAAWLALGVTVWALLLTLTRGAWVAPAVSLVVLAVLLSRWRVVLAGAVALTVVFAFFAPPSWVERVSSIQDLRDVSNYDRLCMAEAAIYMVSERPLFGIGPEMVLERYPIYRHPTAPRATVPHLHNAFLQRAAEQGLVGLTAYLWIMVAALVLAFRGFRDEGVGGARADLYLTVLLVLVGFNVAGLFEDNWRDTELRRLFLFFLAVPLCISAGGRREDGEGPAEGAPNPAESQGARP